MFLHRAEEDPVVPLDGREVFLRLPSLGFTSVPSVHPSPDGLIDHRINGTEGFVADDMPVVVGPTANHRVEFLLTPTYNWLSRISWATLRQTGRAHGVVRGESRPAHRIAS